MYILQEEYDELLQFAVVVPSYKPETLPKTLSDLRGSFIPQPYYHHQQQDDDGNQSDDEGMPNNSHF